MIEEQYIDNKRVLFTLYYVHIYTLYMGKTLESPLDCKEIQPVHSEGDQPWDFFGRKDAKAETPVLWPPDAKSWLIGKDSDAGRDWGQEKKGTIEGEIAGWYHWLDGCESEWTPGVGDGQGGLACCDLWGRKESDTTERLNWTELKERSKESGREEQRKGERKESGGKRKKIINLGLASERETIQFQSTVGLK